MLTICSKEFTVPETICDPTLLLSPHVFLLGILFRHQAFRAPSLVSPNNLDELDIHPDEVELPLPLKQDLDGVYVFRRAVKSLTGYRISAIEPITYGMIAGWIRRIGEILGFQYTTIPYALRYNAANGFDQSREYQPSIPKALPVLIPRSRYQRSTAKPGVRPCEFESVSETLPWPTGLCRHLGHPSWPRAATGTIEAVLWHRSLGQQAAAN